MRALENLDNVLYELCRHACNVMDSWIPYPCNAIAKGLGISDYAARKCIKELREKDWWQRIVYLPAKKTVYLPTTVSVLPSRQRLPILSNVQRLFQLRGG